MKIHIAASRDLRVRAQYLAEQLTADGHQVVSRWLHCDSKRISLADMAQGSLTDVLVADCLVLLAETSQERKGNKTDWDRHVEFGYALKAGKRLCVLGLLETASCHLGQVQQYRSVKELVDGLR